MISDNIENFICRLIDKTKSRGLKWQVIEKMSEWGKIKKEIQEIEKNNLKNYFIDNKKSYYICKRGGYVMVLNIRYSRAQIFSPALDKHILVVKISDGCESINLSGYDCNGYGDLLLELVKEIQARLSEKHDMPDSLYRFFDEFIGEE